MNRLAQVATLSVFFCAACGADKSSTKLPVVQRETPKVNTRPIADDVSFSIAEDTSLEANLKVYDKEGDLLRFSVIDGPESGTLTLDKSTGAFSWTPSLNYVGEDGFTFSVSDGTYSSTAVVGISVHAVDDPPVATDLSLPVSPVDPTELIFAFTDVDGAMSPVTFAVITPPAYGTVTADTGRFYFNPATAGYEVRVSLSVRAFDGHFSAPQVGTIELAAGCVDADLDGYGLHCTAGNDCNDSDPTMYPGAPERADDGVAQACGGVDLQASAASGVFVDGQSGDDMNAGTRAEPVATIGRGISLAPSSGGRVFIAGGLYAENDLVSNGVSLYGGYNAAWSRDLTAYPTTLSSTTTGLKLSGAIVDGLTIVGSGQGMYLGGNATVARSQISSAGRYVLQYASNAQARIENSTLQFASAPIVSNPSTIETYSAGTWGGALFLFGNHIEAAFYPGGWAYGVWVENSALTMDGNVLESNNATNVIAVRLRLSEANATIRNNVIRVGPTVTVGKGIDVDGGRARILNNTIEVTGTSAYQSTGVSVIWNAEAQVVNNHIDVPLGTGISVAQGTTTRGAFYHNNILAYWVARSYFGGYKNAFSAAELNACFIDHCTASGNIGVEPLFMPASYLPAPGSPLIDAAMPPDMLPPGYLVPYDLEGTPRPAGAGWDIGAYEYVE